MHSTYSGGIPTLSKADTTRTRTIDAYTTWTGRAGRDPKRYHLLPTEARDPHAPYNIGYPRTSVPASEFYAMLLSGPPNPHELYNAKSPMTR